jgi:hypothetical protein
MGRRDMQATFHLAFESFEAVANGVKVGIMEYSQCASLLR